MTLSITFCSSAPVGTVDILDVWTDDYGANSYESAPQKLMPYIFKLDCYDVLESNAANLYVCEHYDTDMDSFVFVISTDLSCPEFTRYLLSRDKVPSMWNILGG
jgi:hypothetical protein